VGERSRPPPHKFDEFKGAPYRRRATLRYRLRSGKAFSIDHFLYGLPLGRDFQDFTGFKKICAFSVINEKGGFQREAPLAPFQLRSPSVYII
jgi:hypothetical protein